MKNFCAALFVLCLIAHPARAEEPATPPAAATPAPQTGDAKTIDQRMQEMGDAYKDFKATGSEESRLKAKQNADELLVSMNIAMRAMPVLIGFCKIDTPRAQAMLAMNKRMHEDALTTLQGEKKKQYEDGIAEVEQKLATDWQKRTPEDQERQCAAIRKQMGE